MKTFRINKRFFVDAKNVRDAYRIYKKEIIKDAKVIDSTLSNIYNEIKRAYPEIELTVGSTNKNGVKLGTIQITKNILGKENNIEKFLKHLANKYDDKVNTKILAYPTYMLVKYRDSK